MCSFQSTLLKIVDACNKLLFVIYNYTQNIHGKDFTSVVILTILTLRLVDSLYCSMLFNSSVFLFAYAVDTR